MAITLYVIFIMVKMQKADSLKGVIHEKKKKEAFEDDGRTIANMNVDGMPWYTEAKPLYPAKKEREKTALDELSRREAFKVSFNAMLAGLVVGLIFVGLALLFILFCVFVWFD